MFKRHHPPTEPVSGWGGCAISLGDWPGKGRTGLDWFINLCNSFFFFSLLVPLTGCLTLGRILHAGITHGPITASSTQREGFYWLRKQEAGQRGLLQHHKIKGQGKDGSKKRPQARRVRSLFGLSGEPSFVCFSSRLVWKTPSDLFESKRWKHALR